MDEKPLLLQELRKLKKPLHEYYLNKEEKLSFFERLGKKISAKAGTGIFFMILISITTVWLLWNTFAPANLRFDPVDNNFALWLFVSNIIQLCLLPLILVSENIQNKQMDLGGEADLNINIIAERELENILLHLESQNEKIEKILERLDAKN